MAILIWTSTGIALWHFCVLVPDRFWGGIVGAFLGALVGSIISGGIVQIALGRSLGEGDIVTLLAAIPGTILGLAFFYWLGVRQERREAEAAAAAGQ